MLPEYPKTMSQTPMAAQHNSTLQERAHFCTFSLPLNILKFAFYGLLAPLLCAVSSILQSTGLGGGAGASGTTRSVFMLRILGDVRLDEEVRKAMLTSWESDSREDAEELRDMRVALSWEYGVGAASIL